MDIDLKSVKTVHFIGVGGIGISALARMFLLAGKRVSGSDRTRSRITEELERLGAKIDLDHRAEQVPSEVDLVIYTIAVPADNPERRRAEELGVPMLTYPEALGQLSREKKTVAVAGTHGKTTTTAMLGGIAGQAGLDPTVIVGSLMLGANGAAEQSNLTVGQSDWLIAEACEYRRSFHNLYPWLLIITNIDEDHLDYYRDLADIQDAFQELAGRVPPEGFIVCDPASETVQPVLTEVRGRLVDYTAYDLSELKLQAPGEHNRQNARAAAAAADSMGVDRESIGRGLEEFSGTWRRLQVVGRTPGGAEVYDDYAHHPTEIRAAIQALREIHPGKKLVVIFQPHLYSRTKHLLSELVDSLSGVDQLLLAPTYAAREKPAAGLNQHALAEEIRRRKLDLPVKAFDSLEAIPKAVENLAGPDTVVVTMGAGDVNKLHLPLIYSSR